MNNTNEWKYFKVSDVFDCPKINKYSSIPDITGNIPFVSSTAVNNGIKNYIDGEPIKGNCITVSTNGNCFDCFYQPNPICVSTDVEVLYSPFLNEINALFIIALLKLESYRWSYGRKPKNGKVKNSLIKFPVDNMGNINWKFMEQYINNIMEKKINNTKIKDLLKSNNKIPAKFTYDNSWKKFNLQDLYKIVTGNKFDKNKMTFSVPKINFVSRISFNNGVDGKVDFIEDVEPFPKGLITVALGGSYLGSTFVQYEPFYTGQNIAVLYPKFNVMSLEVNLFISTIIRTESRQHYQAFGRELNKHISNDFAIKLPTINNEIPNWEFMENYIKSLPYGDKI